MNKFDKKMLIYALCMMVFVFGGALGFRNNANMILGSEVPQASADGIYIYINGNENITQGFRITDSLNVKLKGLGYYYPASLSVTLCDPNGGQMASIRGQQDSSGDFIATIPNNFNNMQDLSDCYLKISYSYYDPNQSLKSASKTIKGFTVAGAYTGSYEEPIFDYSVSSSSVLRPGMKIEATCKNSHSVTVTGLSMSLIQNGQTLVTSKTGTRMDYQYSGTTSYDGYRNSITVPQSLQVGPRVTIKLVATCADVRGGGAPQVYTDELSCSTGASSEIGVNPYSNMKFYINGYENPSSSISLWGRIVVNVASSKTIDQVMVYAYDSNGRKYYSGTDYGDTVVIQDLGMYANGANVSDSIFEIVAYDMNRNNYSVKIPVSLYDDTKIQPSTKGAFTNTTSSKTLKTNDVVSYKYKAGQNETIRSIRIRLIDDNGNVIAENQNNPGSGVTTIDVSAPVETNGVSNNAKLVCDVAVSTPEGTKTWQDMESNYTVNVGMKIGTINISADTDNWAHILPGKMLRFNTSTNVKDKLTSFEIVVEKDGKTIDQQKLSLNTSAHSYGYKINSGDYGSYVFYITCEGMSNGKMMEPVSAIYHYEVGTSEWKIILNTNLEENQKVNLKSFTSTTGIFFITGVYTYQGDGYMSKANWELYSKKDKFNVASGTIQSGQFLNATRQIGEINEFFTKNTSAVGDYILILTGINEKGVEVKKEIPFSVIDTSAELFTFSANPPNGSKVKDGDEITIDFISSNKTAKKLNYFYTIAGTNGGKAGNVQNSTAQDKLTVTVPVEYKGDKESVKFNISVTGTDTNGKEYKKEFEYTIEQEIKKEIEVKNVKFPETRKTFKLKDKIDYDFGDGKAKIELVNKKTGSLITSKSNVSKGSLDLSNNEGTYDLKITTNDENNNPVTEVYTYYVLDSDLIVDPNIKEGLSIDLFINSKERFFNSSKKIPMKIYYMNSGSSELDDVSIKVNVPEGLKLINLPVGFTQTDGVIKLGKVPAGYLGVIKFDMSPLKEADSKFTIEASIFSGEKEKDTSVSEAYLFKEGSEIDTKSYITGYPDGTVKPDSEITRAEVAAIFTRAFDLDEKGKSSSFNDLKKTSWAYPYVNACAANDIITGYTDGTFKGNNNITVSELATMIYRATRLDLNDPLLVPDKYEDKSTWEKNYISGLERLNMLESLETKDWSKNATRGDVIHLVNEALFINPDKSLVPEFNDVSNSHAYKSDIAVSSKDLTMKRTSSGTSK